MVPICVGDRENRGPSDHVRTIFYMSRATPEKRKVWSARPGSWPAGLRPSPSLAHRDHGPDGPDGPDGCLEFGKLGLRFAQAPPGPSRHDGPNEATRSARPSAEPPVGVPRDLLVRVTPGSIGVGSGAPSLQPAVVLALLCSSRSYVEAACRRGGSLWLPPWFQASGSSASRCALWANPSVRGDHGDRNNCWHFSPVFSFCLGLIGASP
jgi:hypothetical protein